MGRRVASDACLSDLLQIAVGLCQQAGDTCPRKGPGRPPDYPDWLIAVLIMVATLKRRKSKSAQYRFLEQNQALLLAALEIERLPSRGTYCQRYVGVQRLLQEAIRLQGVATVKERLVDVRCVAGDKSLLAAQGPVWPKKAKEEGRVPRGVDREASWSYSKHHGWVYGYSYEVVVSAGKNGVVLPLLASAGGAHLRETKTFADKVAQLPTGCRYVLLDAGYDSNALAEEVEWTPDGKRTGRRCLCPQIYRRGDHRRPSKPRVERGTRRRHRDLRDQRRAFLQTAPAQKLYVRRGQTVEPYNQWFKSLFAFQNRVWHRGLDNNRTQLLAAIFVYQLLVRYNHRRGNQNGAVQWILDGL
jgi:hypothetical protein